MARKTLTELIKEEQSKLNPTRVVRSLYVDKPIWEAFKRICSESNLSQGDVFSMLVKVATQEKAEAVSESK